MRFRRVLPYFIRDYIQFTDTRSMARFMSCTQLESGCKKILIHGSLLPDSLGWTTT